MKSAFSAGYRLPRPPAPVNTQMNPRVIQKDPYEVNASSPKVSFSGTP